MSEESFWILTRLPEILNDDKELELGEFGLDMFKITVNRVKTYEKELIKCER